MKKKQATTQRHYSPRAILVAIGTKIRALKSIQKIKKGQFGTSAVSEAGSLVPEIWKAALAASGVLPSLHHLPRYWWSFHQSRNADPN